MPQNKEQSQRTFTSPSAPWTAREAYLLALVCLLSGLVLGYMFHGSSPAVAASAVAASSPAPGPAAPAAMPTASDLAPLAAPLLAALKADPKNADTLIQLGNFYYDHQVYPESIEYYTRALALRPKEVNVRTDLGTAYWYSGFPEKAVKEYEQSLAADPGHTNTLFNMGVVKLEGMKDPMGASKAFEKLLATNPQAPQRERAIELLARARGMKK